MNEITVHSMSRQVGTVAERRTVFDPRAHAGVIRSIALELGADERIVGRLYEREWTALAARAKVLDFLAVFAERSVRDSLQTNRSS
ncbi:MAG: DUF3562 domain-containing protein [Gammaproteobacteria bacterium]|nr:DUF3562 domain-containing protein [Gammaproteobacteria bacterium]